MVFNCEELKGFIPMQDNSNSDSRRLLKQIFTELEESVLNADRASDCKVELQDLLSRKEGHIKRERRILDDVKGVLDEYVKEENFDEFKTYHEAILSYVGSSLDTYEVALSEFLSKDLSAKEDEIKSYQTKSVRSLETFLSRDPIESIETEVNIKYLEGGYEARYRSVCQKEVEYEFILNASEVEFFRTRLEGNTLMKGLKLPVRYAKAWVSKDPVLDYEKLDDYYMSQASISDNQLFVTFVNEETGSEFKFHSSVSDGAVFLEVDYKDSLQSVSLTTQPALNSNLNRDAVNDLMNQIRTALWYLKDHKLRLVKILLRNVDIVSNLKVSDLFYTILEILSPRLSTELTNVIAEDAPVSDDEDKILNREFIASRLDLLGERAQTVSAILGISGFTDSFPKT